ncbi:type II toxin-antitoxin system PemK/MazF family toxin [Streptomyces griseoflavus]|uniref:type II toxin-antitoxin system PemK/MazF family toxin n=1 Tax=Streptomyces griseoflavus TaxID=35619 RepID=UPI00167C4686|nr:type II toxin-antitoxin system PemK/MazF family toxin [Streptomyces griseoflavus]GGV12304.1 mRNA interferase [Streptomyces griseoflavus]
MKRGDIHWVDYEPARGAEAGTARPGVIVSNDGADAAVERAGRGVITLVPLSTDTSRVHPFQVRAPAPERPLRPIGVVPRQRMAEIDTALRRHPAP